MASSGGAASPSLASPSSAARAEASTLPDHVLPPESSEQRAIVEQILLGRNVLVAAGAGSGKTTTALHIALALSRARCTSFTLVVTYSKALQGETANRITSLKENLTSPSDRALNMYAFTLHSLMQNVYGYNCAKDNGLSDILEADPEPKQPWRLAKICTIVVDEVQDLDPLRFAALAKFRRDLAKYQASPNECHVGDEKQTVYSFSGADGRFLRFADQLIVNGHEWRTLPLMTSYRLTLPMVRYVNEVMHGGKGPPLVSGSRLPVASQKPVIYFTGPTYDVVKEIVKSLLAEFGSGRLRFDDVMVLATSLKLKQDDDTFNTPLQLLVMLLSQANVDVEIRSGHLPNSNDAVLLKHKLLLSTIAGSKGSERRLVIVFDHSNDYFVHIGRKENPLICPSGHHVAATRAKEQLWIVGENKKDGFVPYRNSANFYALVEQGLVIHRPVTERWVEKDEVKEKKWQFTATGLLDYVHNQHIVSLSSKLAFTRVQPPCGDPIKLTHVLERTKCEDGKEYTLTDSVAEVNGLALPCLLEMIGRRASTVFQAVEELSLTPADKENAQGKLLVDSAKRLVKTYPLGDGTLPLSLNTDAERRLWKLSVAWALEACALFRASANPIAPFFSFYSQLKDATFDWIDVQTAFDVVKMLAENVRGHADAATAFEVPMQRALDDDEAEGEDAVVDVALGVGIVERSEEVVIEGMIDVVTDDTLFEIKCVNGPLTLTHLLQLAVYAWVDRGRHTHYVIFNALTGERYNLDAVESDLDAVVSALVAQKKTTKPTLADDEFLAAAKAISKDKKYTMKEIGDAFTPLAAVPLDAASLFGRAADAAGGAGGAGSEHTAGAEVTEVGPSAGEKRPRNE
jgi:hypothetical protein